MDHRKCHGRISWGWVDECRSSIAKTAAYCLSQWHWAKEGLIFKSTVYYLDITIETTPNEMALIKKHQWDKKTMG